MRRTPARSRQAAWAQVADRLSAGTPAERRAARQGFVLANDQARLLGVSSAQSRRLMRHGLWTAPRRGVICVLPVPVSDTDEPHGLRPEVLAAAAAITHERSLISHEFAALTYGLPVLHRLERATLTTPNRYEACSRRGVIVWAADIHPDEISSWFGIPRLTLARTVVDVARHDLRGGLVAADAALYEGLVTTAQLAVAVERAYQWHGVKSARRMLELATPFAESPLESLTRLFIADRNIVLPRPQALIPTRGGVYRVDGLWDDRRVILEVDGMLKYRDDEDALSNEKKRQEDLEQAGYRVVRVSWFDIHHDPERTEFRIRQALAAGPPSYSPARPDLRGDLGRAGL